MKVQIDDTDELSFERNKIMKEFSIFSRDAVKINSSVHGELKNQTMYNLKVVLVSDKRIQKVF